MVIGQPTPLAISKFRYRLHRSFHRSWLFLLNCGASYYLTKIAVDNSYLITTLRLRQENERYQEELSNYFAPFYQACLPCKSSCCTHMETPPPAMALDHLLFDIFDRKSAHFNKINLNWIVKKITTIVNYGKSNHGLKRNFIPCPRLTTKGCSLIWGQRPTVCVILLCSNFCKFMSWRDYWRFMLKCTSYLFFLTKSLHKLAR